MLESKSLSGSKISLKISVSQKDIAEREQKLLEDYKPKIAVKGFRKGKVPESVLKSHLGKELKGEAISKIIPEALSKVIEEKKYPIISQPTIDNVNEDDKTLTFTAIVEVRPEVPLCEYKEIPIELPKYKVEESEVDKEVELLKQNSATWVVKEGTAEKGDGVVINAKAFDESGKLIENSEKKNQLYEIGLKDNIKEVDEALTGKKGGDKFEITVKMPKEYFIKEFREKNVKFEIEVNEIKFKKYPEVNDDFAKEFGEFKSLDDLKNKIRENIGKVKENNYKKEQYKKIEDYLIANTKIDAPESLVKAQSDFLKEEQKNYLVSMGLKDTENYVNSEESLKTRDEAAERQVKMLLIIDEIAEKEKIMASDEDVDKEIEKIASAYNKKPLAIKAKLEANQSLPGLKKEIVRNKTMDFLFENAKRS